MFCLNSRSHARTTLFCFEFADRGRWRGRTKRRGKMSPLELLENEGSYVKDALKDEPPGKIRSRHGDQTGKIDLIQ
jgi:hypothetical protein